MLQWAADAQHRQLLPAWRRGPSVAIIHRIMAGVDAEVLDAVVGDWLNARREHQAGHDPGASSLVAVAIDGKEVCGAKHGEGTKTMLLAALDHDSGTVIGQQAVDAKTNEIPHLPHLLDQLGDLDGTVITVDARHTLAQQAEAIVDRGGHYVFTVKPTPKPCTKPSTMSAGRVAPRSIGTPKKATAGSVLGP